MSMLAHFNRYGLSLPVRGAWIEICLSMMCATFPHGRSPCGERGLKFLQQDSLDFLQGVAPRAGSVD